MVKKLQKLSAKASTDSASPLAGAVKESAQQIWLAGLGAFSKAQQEGSKVFETLVKEGLSVQRKTQAVAEERITDATSRMSSMANDITTKATGQWDKLETIFEDRVARTLNKLGVPSAQDIDALIARIDELNRSVQQLQPAAVAAPKQRPVVAPKAEPVAKKAAPKKAAARKAATPAVAPVAAEPAPKRVRAARKPRAQATPDVTAPAADTSAPQA